MHAVLNNIQDIYMSANMQVYLGDGKSRAPLFLQNIQADAAIAVNIWMEHLCLECNLAYLQLFFVSNRFQFVS
jgi:hypothetical protein